MKHFLETRDLSIRASGLELDFPFLRLEQGQTHCLIGRSGSGKSLLATALAGLRIPGIRTSGQILLDGLPSASSLWRDHVFLLPQEPGLALDPTMSVGKQIAEVLKWRQAADCVWTDAGALAREVGLEDADLTKMPAALSGGMQQRAMIAIALAARASFIVADEPTKGLDTHNKARVIALLKKLQSLERGLLVITHDLEVTRGLADTLSVIDAGRIVEQGPAARILGYPQSAAARSLVENEPAQWPSRVRSGKVKQDPVVHLSAVDFGFAPHHTLIENVSLEIRRGEVVGLFGASGIGKSTLGDLCLALNTPNKGRLRWHGNLVTQRLARRFRARFQKLFQNPVAAFPPNLELATVFKKLTPVAQDAPLLSDLLQALDLNEELLDRRPDQLSGGELQRMAIVRMLLGQPDFIVCDEPSSRLDTTVQRQTLDVIVADVRKRSAGALLISHDLEVLRKRADRILELTEAGTLVPLKEEEVQGRAA
ncbi:ATP-binding cassette domain-containing protein [uncultured Roseibium sp.]|uniref:ABC transporter ATP-binding protein n=1 Tax=uncultured Roseibium sp. TaxID=1936171 RepID=UPI002627B616|nr:ATP-binding cassette domain-containing protein [uncultured Roseibium sp.]